MKNAQTVIMTPRKTGMCRSIVSREAGEGILKPFQGDGQKEGAQEPTPPADMRGSDNFQGMVEDGRWAGLVPAGDSFAVLRSSLRRGDGVGLLGLQRYTSVGLNSLWGEVCLCVCVFPVLCAVRGAREQRI